MKKFTFEGLVCPSCAYPMSGLMNTRDATPPHPGALVLCLGCEGVLVFTEDLTLHALTPPELALLSPVTQQDIAHYCTALRAARASLS